MHIFEISKTFPKEERYSLTDQMRKSSRSVCSCIGEAYRKRQYEAHFVSKSSDADAENTETRVWLDFALAYGYIVDDTWQNLESKADEVGRLLNHDRESQKISKKIKKRRIVRAKGLQMTSFGSGVMRYRKNRADTALSTAYCPTAYCPTVN